MPTNRSRTSDDLEWYDSFYNVPAGMPFPCDHCFFQKQVWGTYYDRIDDVLDPGFRSIQRSKKRLPLHDANHVKVRMFIPKNMHDYAASQGHSFTDNHEAISCCDINQILALMPGPSQGTLSSYADKAFEKLWPQIPEQVSIANFAYELREWKMLKPSFSKNLKESVSGNFLSFQFGWLPLVGDLKKLYSLQETIQKRLQFLKDTSGKRVRVSCGGDIDPYGPVETATNIGDPPVSHYRLRYERQDYKGTWRCTGYIYHELEGLDDSLTQLKAFSAGLGLNNPISVVWNAIPYSFVFDWFTRFGSLLDRLAVQPFGGTWQISDVSFSTQEKMTFRAYQSPSASADMNLLLGTGTIERYVRQVGLPASSLFATDAGLDTRKQLLALSLIHVRM